MQFTKVPMRLINGSTDPVSGEHLAACYEALVPDPDVVRLPGIGHYPQVEAPEAVLEAFLAFHAALVRRR
jgi:pimeloyl-ACP methyl ester carboxylesterase